MMHTFAPQHGKRSSLISAIRPGSRPRRSPRLEIQKRFPVYSCSVNVAKEYCKSNIDNARALAQIKEDQERHDAVQKLLARKSDVVLKSWKHYDAWDRWMAQQAQWEYRQDVMVIVGPTKTGKTEFAMAKCGPDTLVVNCHNVVEPDLRKFKGAHIHSAIILDEGGPRLLALHRDLLQATRRDITLGHSQTNMYTYTVNLYRVKIIITSNAWYDDLAKLSQGDQDWIAGNTVMLDVDSTTYITEEEEACKFLQRDASS